MSSTSAKTELWAHTKSDTFQLNFNWTIDNFSLYLEDPPTQFAPINSPEYSASGHEDVRFLLCLYPNSLQHDTKDYPQLFLYCLTSSYSSPVYVKYKMSLVNEKGQNQHSAGGHYKFINSSAGPSKVFARSVLLDPANGLLLNDQLTIRCEAIICFKYENESSLSELLVEDDFGKCEKKFNLDMGSLLLGPHSDVILSVVDGIEWPAHKGILSVRSPVFAAMFSHQDTKEAQEGKVEIADVPNETFKDLLEFIYTGKFPAKERLTTELLAVPRARGRYLPVDICLYAHADEFA